MAWVKFLIRALAGFATLFLFVLYVYPGYAAMGAAALREAWLGGERVFHTQWWVHEPRHRNQPADVWFWRQPATL